MNPLVRGAAAIAITCSIGAPALAQTASPRDTLIRAAFATRDKPQALALISQALAQTQAMLARNANDREARLQQALATGYRGQLNRSPSDAKATRVMLLALAASDPRDAETQIAVAGWHLTAVSDLGGFLAGTLLGARRTEGLAALDRAVVIGGNRAFFPGYAALIRIRVDSGDTTMALRLAERAATAAAPGPIDRIMQRAALRLLVPLKAGDGTAASKLAKVLLPFGTIG
jgi:hypothetical protein